MREDSHGLTNSEASRRLQLHGPNILPHKKPVADFLILWEQIKSPLIYILIIASLISFFLGDYKDGLVIMAAVVINTVLGFYQERKAQKALYALKQILSPMARVLREGKVISVDVKTIVPGDIVLLAVGDRIAADGYVIEEVNLTVNESVLTGESVAVGKEIAKNIESETSKNAQVYMGTTVVFGRGKMIVTKTGLSTEFGKIAAQLSLTKEEPTPLQTKINSLAGFLAILFAATSFIVFIWGVFAGRTFIEMFTVSVAVAVAAIPEGMAVSLTAILAIGMQRILKRNALVRKLVAVEALGSTTVIATDKTGTLTQGNMKVVRTKFTDTAKALTALTLANNREDPLELAIWQYVQKKGLDPQEIKEVNKTEEELPFDALTKYMAVSYRNDQGNFTVYCKGAPEIVLALSNLNPKEKEKWLQSIREWGSEGLRLIGVAVKKTESKGSLKKNINRLTWLGLVGITDPIRETVKEALIKTREAGIKLKVITGDYALTSKTILANLGIKIKGEEILEGEEIERLSKEELSGRVEKTVLFARVTPIQKLKIVNTLQEKGEIVALLGDGVNDAPAIKAANIGVVVDSATDVARQTADMVLLDSNFQTIIDAVEEGRGIYQNVKKVVFYLLAGSFSEVFLVFGAIILGLPLPLTASQILWINIVTDNLPNLALTVDPKEKNLLKDRPVNINEGIMDRLMTFLVAFISGATGILLLIIFAIVFGKTKDLNLARTVVFVGLGLTSLFYVFSIRTLKRPLWKSRIFSNRLLLLAVFLGLVLQIVPLYSHLFQNLLGTVSLSFLGWQTAATVPFIIIGLIEITKAVIIVPKRKASF